MKATTGSPGGKKLKQVKLNFGFSPVTPVTPVTPAVPAEPASAIEPIIDLVELDEPGNTSIAEGSPSSPPAKKPRLEQVVAIDDDSEPESKIEEERSSVNPYVLLVDCALKRKLNKRKDEPGAYCRVPSPSDDEKNNSDADQSEEFMEIDSSDDENDETNSDDTDKSVNGDTLQIDTSVNDKSMEVDPTKSDQSAKTPKRNRQLTPKQIEKRLESARKREERLKEKSHRDHQKQLEKEERARLKQERDEQRQKEREERERLKEEQRKMREERERFKKESEKKKKEAKEEERKRRDEAAEEAKRRKELEKEELENKKRKASQAFVSFFVPKEKIQKTQPSIEQSIEDRNHNYLSTFTIKVDMRLAPIYRRKLTADDKSTLDTRLTTQETAKTSLYLSQIKSNYSKGASVKTWPLNEAKNDLILIEDDLPSADDTKEEDQILLDVNRHKGMRPKLFSFSENRRPPYWGTWRRKSRFVNGRRPFATDKTHLDYECDSDDDWEEEEPGESVESVAGSDDEEDENEYDVDNEFMVPHGYLSDEEILGDDDKSLAPEALKAKLSYLVHQFEDEMKKPATIKKPRIIGIFWQDLHGDKPDSCSDIVWDFLNQKKMLTSTSEITIEETDNAENDLEPVGDRPMKSSRKITEDMIPNLIKLTHGNTNSRNFLIKEFQMFIANSEKTDDGTTVINVSKVSISKKIKEISTWMPCPDEGPMCTKMCWYVDREIREKYNLNNLSLPNDWSYVLLPKKRTEISKKDKCKSPSVKPNNENKTMSETSIMKTENKFNITKFTQVMTPEDRKKQFVSQTTPPVPEKKPASEPDNLEKKRVSLVFLGCRNVNLPSPEQKPEETPQLLQEKNSNIPESKTKPPTEEPPKKRVALLASGPRGKELNKPIKTNLLTQFIENAPTKYNKAYNAENDNDDPIELSD